MYLHFLVIAALLPCSCFFLLLINQPYLYSKTYLLGLVYFFTNTLGTQLAAAQLCIVKICNAQRYFLYGVFLAFHAGYPTFQNEHPQGLSLIAIIIAKQMLFRTS